MPLGRVAAAIKLKIFVADHLNQLRTQRLGGPAQHDVTRRVGGLGFRAEFATLFIHDAFAANNDDILLKVVKMFDPLNQKFEIGGVLGHENDVRPAIRRAQRDVTGVPPHHFDDGNAPMAFRRRADPLDTLRGNEHGRRVAWRDVIDDVVEIEDRAGRGALVAETGLGRGVIHADPFIGFARIVQAQVVVDRLGREHHRQPFGERLETVERAVAANADQAFNAKFPQAGDDLVKLLRLLGVNKIPGRTDERAALGRIEFGNFLKQRIEMDVRDARIEQAVETLDQADDFDLELVGAHDRAVDGGVERGSVAAGRENADAFHRWELLALRNCCCCSSCCTMISSSKLLNG